MKRWYQQTWCIVLFLFLYFPVGLILMWTQMNWIKPVKIGVSAFIIGLFGTSLTEESSPFFLIAIIITIIAFLHWNKNAMSLEHNSKKKT